MDNLTAFSAHVNFHVQAGAGPGITFPLVQGMGFITGLYYGLKPVIQSSVFVRNLARASDYPRAGVFKYRITLEDGKSVRSIIPANMLPN